MTDADTSAAEVGHSTNDTERPDYCEVSDSCYRQPDRFTVWMDECEPWEDNYLWMCEPCYKAIKYGNQIPVGNLRIEWSIDTDTERSKERDAS